MQPSLPGVLVASYWCYEGCNCEFNSDLELSKTIQLLDSFSHFHYIIQIFDTFKVIHLLVFLFHVIIKVWFSFFKFVLYYVKVVPRFENLLHESFPAISLFNISVDILSEFSFLSSILLLHILQLHPKQNESSVF